MRRLFLAVVSLVLSLGGRGLGAAEPLAAPETLLLGWHFAGATAAAPAWAGTKLSTVGALPETPAAARVLQLKLAQTLPTLLWPTLPTNSAAPRLLAPLLEDLWRLESAAEWAGPGPAAGNWLVAVRTGPDRAGLWSSNLWFALRGTNPPVPPAPEWAHVAAGTGEYRLLRQGDWTVFGHWRDDRSRAAAVRRLTSLPATTGLELTFNTRAWAPFAAAGADDGHHPTLHLAVAPRGENVSVRGKLAYPRSLGQTLPAWQVPLDTIRDPVTSFTAVRGLQGWLARQPWFAALGLSAAPDQFYLWAHPAVAMQTFVAARVPGATNEFARRLPAWLAAGQGALTNEFTGRAQSSHTTNGVELVWRGMPILTPFVRPAGDTRNEYLLAGLFHPAFHGTNLPPELVAQVTRPAGLLYYDWEITEVRLKHWLQLSPLLSLGANRLPVASEQALYQWLRAAAPLLGNTVTEATLAGPQEVQVVRQGHLGLTGFEVYHLVRWLDQRRFPQWDPPRRLPAGAALPPPPARK